jgi:hypothetical protein
MIPAFDHNLVLPPHLGDPSVPEHISPYPCHTMELCERFGFSVERRKILEGFLNFRDRIRAGGITNGYQWVDGSFVEHVEARDSKSPSDIDVVTVYWGYPLPVQVELMKIFPEFSNPALAKQNFLVDHYPFDAGFSPVNTLDWTRYWCSLFSHNKKKIWKGMLRIEINTPAEDAVAREQLAALASFTPAESVPNTADSPTLAQTPVSNLP